MQGEEKGREKGSKQERRRGGMELCRLLLPVSAQGLGGGKNSRGFGYTDVIVASYTQIIRIDLFASPVSVIVH